MPTYIALLRGINVAGHKPVKMAALVASCEALGFADVRTYLQSGNVVFGAPAAPPIRLAGRIAERLRRDLGLAIAVLVKAERDWKAVRDRNPFLAEPGMDPAKLHVTFPFEPPAQAGLVKLAALKAGRDRYALAAGVIYLHCPDGYGRSKLSNTILERVLSVAATTRNWRTVNELYRLAAE
jgi:uncharacterized protein (DUF1697 family)